MKFPCPLCKNPKTVKINRKSRPYLRCDDCGVLMFVNRSAGIKRIQDEQPALTDVKPLPETLDSFLSG
jgi:hypothetical protein